MPGSDRAPLLVVGATGRVGRLLAPHWSGAVLQQTRGTANAPGWVSFEPGDGRVPDLPGERTGAMLVLAGVTPGPGARLGDNAAIARAAADTARAAGVTRILFASTQAVYGAPIGRGFREDDLPAPASDYARAKLEAEAAIRASGIATCCLRIGNVAGADQLLINARAATAEAPVRLDRFADGAGPRRSYIAPRTLARVIEALADTEGLPDVLNVAAPEPVTMEALLEAAGVPWRFVPAPESAVQDVTLDVSELARRFAFTPRDSDPADMAAGMRTAA